MPTVEELDAKIEERRRQIARFEERKKALIAKEREQQKKWQTLVVSAIGGDRHPRGWLHMDGHRP